MLELEVRDWKLAQGDNFVAIDLGACRGVKATTTRGRHRSERAKRPGCRTPPENWLQELLAASSCTCSRCAHSLRTTPQASRLDKPLGIQLRLQRDDLCLQLHLHLPRNVSIESNTHDLGGTQGARAHTAPPGAGGTYRCSGGCRSAPRIWTENVVS